MQKGKRIWMACLKNTNFWLLLAVWFISTFCFFYGDQIVTVGHSVIFWRPILHGNIAGGYQECLDVIRSTVPHRSDIPAIYEPMAYIIVGGLSAPLIFLNELGKLQFDGIAFNMYVKFQQLLLAFGSSYAVMKICLELKLERERAKYAAFLFLSNIGLIYYAIVVGQLEIYVCFFSLWGIYYWIKRDDFKFILFFAIAIPLKLFSILIFFPLVLIRQKNIVRAILMTFAGCSFYVVSKIIWLTDSAYRISISEPGQRMIEVMKSKQIAGGLGTEGIPIFVCLYLLICFFVYINKREDGIWGIYCSFTIYALMFIFVEHYPYWIVILTPFLPIMVAADKKNEKINLIADIVLWISYMVSALFYHTWITHYSMIDNMLLPYIFGKRGLDEVAYSSVGDYLNSYYLQKYAVFFVACYVAALLALIIINHPENKKEFALLQVNEKILNSVRILLIVPFFVLICFCYYSPKPDLLMDTTDNESMDMGYNLFSQEFNKYGEQALVQNIVFDQNAKLKRMGLVFTRPSNSYAANGSLYFQIKDMQTQEILHKERIGYNELIWGDFTFIDMDSKEVKKDHRYAILISTDNWQELNLWTNIKITTSNVLEESLNYMGNDVGYDLYMKIEGEWL